CNALCLWIIGKPFDSVGRRRGDLGAVAPGLDANAGTNGESVRDPECLIGATLALRDGGVIARVERRSLHLHEVGLRVNLLEQEHGKKQCKGNIQILSRMPEARKNVAST